jgi:hypothetical protein
MIDRWGMWGKFKKKKEKEVLGYGYVLSNLIIAKNYSLTILAVFLL